MVQFNLLPDVKKDYIKAKRTKRLISSVAFLVTATFVGITVLVFIFVRFAQTKNISDLTEDIENSTAQIQNAEDLNKKLTVQNQLNILTPLHEGRPETSRVFDYVRFFSPETAELSSLRLDADEGIINITGTIVTLAEANRLVDNIKAVTYETFQPDENQPETVTETAYTVIDSSVSSDGAVARFEVEFEYEPDIFDNTIEVVMRLKDQLITTKTDEGGQQ